MTVSTKHLKKVDIARLTMPHVLKIKINSLIYLIFQNKYLIFKSNKLLPNIKMFNHGASLLHKTYDLNCFNVNLCCNSCGYLHLYNE